MFHSPMHPQHQAQHQMHTLVLVNTYCSRLRFLLAAVCSSHMFCKHTEPAWGLRAGTIAGNGLPVPLMLTDPQPLAPWEGQVEEEYVMNLTKWFS